MVQRSFFFGATDIAALRLSLPPHLRHCTKFELIAACAWRCRTIAISPDPNEEVRFLCVVNTRKRFNPPLPKGYYGNAIVVPAAITNAEKLLKNPLHYALELVQTAKSEATEEEYLKSVSDLMVIKGRPNFKLLRTCMLYDVTHAGFSEVDFGWGEAVYGGPIKTGIDQISGVLSFCLPFNNNKGEERVVLLCLPTNAMKVFEKELEMMMMTARKSLIYSASAL